MPCYVGLDTAKKLTSVCVLSAKGELIREGQVETTPKALIEFLRGDRRRYALIGMEVGPMAPWLCEGLIQAGLRAVCIDARHAHGALKTQPNKTDRSDARGIAHLMRTGSYRAVHIKSSQSSMARALIKSRKLLISKLRDLQSAIKGFLLAYGLKAPRGEISAFGPKAQALVRKHKQAESVIAPLMEVCSVALEQIEGLNERLAQLAADDPVCRLLMSAPGVGPITALIFRAAVDHPGRFTHSRTVGAHFGLTPRTYQSGEIARRGAVSKCGDADVRTALFWAAMVLMRANVRRSWLRDWGEQIAARRGRARALVAVARRLAIILHRMWITDTPFRWERLA
jgi:transposase